MKNNRYIACGALSVGNEVRREKIFSALDSSAQDTESSAEGKTSN